MGLPEREAAYLLEQIEEYVNPARRGVADRTAPTGLKVYGVRVPELRKIAKAWVGAHRDIAHDDLFALVEALWDGGSREEREMAFCLLEHFERWVPDLSKAHFERCRRDLDSWVETDGLGWTLAVWVAGGPDERLGYLWELIDDENVWSRRLALVPLARINRGKLGFTALDLKAVS
jgi:hypothetical protein